MSTDTDTQEIAAPGAIRVGALGSGLIYLEQRELFSSTKFMPIASPALVALDKNVMSPIG